MSKILENIFSNRLLTFLSTNNSISDTQYGFRVKSSTSSAIADATNYITSSLDKDYFTMGIFIDLRKAFDTVDHAILLKNWIFMVYVVCRETF